MRISSFLMACDDKSRICDLNLQRSVIWYVFMWWRSRACRDFVTSELNALPSLTFCHRTAVCLLQRQRFASSGWSLSPSVLCTWFSGFAFVRLVSLHVCACWSVWFILWFFQLIWRRFCSSHRSFNAVFHICDDWYTFFVCFVLFFNHLVVLQRIAPNNYIYS